MIYCIVDFKPCANCLVNCCYFAVVFGATKAAQAVATAKGKGHKLSAHGYLASMAKKCGCAAHCNILAHQEIHCVHVSTYSKLDLLLPDGVVMSVLLKLLQGLII
jgi:hypothetical protein